MCLNVFYVLVIICLILVQILVVLPELCISLTLEIVNHSLG